MGSPHHLERTAEHEPLLTLYGSPLACSGAAHLALLELGLPHELVHVDIYAQPHVVLADGTPYSEINPKNAVPALRLVSGALLTEVGVILQYLADSKPDQGLLPAAGTLARYRALEWLSFVGSDVHKTIGPLFHPRMPPEAKELHRQNLARRLAHIDHHLSRQPYLVGDTFTVADAYLFVMVGWHPYFKLDPTPYRSLLAFHERVLARPSVTRMRELIGPIVGQLALPEFPRVALPPR